MNLFFIQYFTVVPTRELFLEVAADVTETDPLPVADFAGTGALNVAADVAGAGALSVAADVAGAGALSVAADVAGTGS